MDRDRRDDGVPDAELAAVDADGAPACDVRDVVPGDAGVALGDVPERRPSEGALTGGVWTGPVIVDGVLSDGVVRPGVVTCGVVT